MVMRSPCAGEALDPPLLKIPNTLSLSLARGGDHFETFCLPQATMRSQLES